MSAFNAWDIYVKTDPLVLNPTAFDTTVNTLTVNYSVTVNSLTSCINGLGSGCNPAGGDGPGVVHSAILPLGSPPPGSIITGVLFNITYTVMNGAGVSGVVLHSAQLSDNTGAVLTMTTRNGIYGNANLPKVDFYWTPTSPSLEQVVDFFSNSSDPNLGGGITGYVWNFGDNSGPHSGLGANVTNIIYTHSSGGQPVNATCGAAERFVVQLTVTDKLGIENSQTHLLFVRAVSIHDLGVANVKVLPKDAVFPGTAMTVNASIQNYGTFDEGIFNVSLYVENRFVAQSTVDSTSTANALLCNAEQVFPLKWDTTGLAPGIYQITVSVSPIRNATSPKHEVLENNLQNNVFVGYVRIIDPTASSLILLTMPESIGAIAALIVGVIVTRILISRERAKKRSLADMLEQT
jgi:CARDB